MLAGVGPVRLVLFVVAADEGWKPQSEEHLQILDVLGVDGGVVALTKRDLVDAETLAIAEDGDRASGSPARRSRARRSCRCSSVTGEGIDELRDALDAMLAAAPAPEDARARLFVDRVFTIKGAGTVVTGTLTGECALGRRGGRALPDAGAAPGSARSRRTSAPRSARGPVSRVAANLVGAERRDPRARRRPRASRRVAAHRHDRGVAPPGARARARRHRPRRLQALRGRGGGRREAPAPRSHEPRAGRRGVRADPARRVRWCSTCSTGSCCARRAGARPSPAGSSWTSPRPARRAPTRSIGSCDARRVAGGASRPCSRSSAARSTRRRRGCSPARPAADPLVGGWLVRPGLREAVTEAARRPPPRTTTRPTRWRRGRRSQDAGVPWRRRSAGEGAPADPGSSRP